jgi:S-formylglutathione hydrolase FrmB
MNIPRSAVGLAVLLAPSLVRAETRTFHSASLGKDVSYSVQLPPSYGAGRKLPVLYVLHGLFEGPEFWERRGLAAQTEALWEKKAIPEFIVVAVDGGNSFFVNGPLGRYEDLVTKDLVAQVESTLPVVPTRKGRALLGVSMGGYAALRIAFTRPDLFSAVGTHSAMLLETIPRAEDGAGRWQMSAFYSAFGNPIDAKLWAASDPLAEASSVDPKALPGLYFDCGSEDRYGLFHGNEALHKALEARGIPHEFALHPGNHGYEYVRSVLDRSLAFLGRALANS